MSKISIMISSTVKDLISEREAISDVFSGLPFVELLGTTPFLDASSSESSAFQTIGMAKKCDLYMLLLGARFGMMLSNGKSATETEFDAAYQADPTKILVFLKKEKECEEKQQHFIERVSDYYSGYWRTEFSTTEELKEHINNSFYNWIKERISLGSFSTADHFIRLAVSKKPTPDTNVLYAVKDNYIELEYHYLETVKTAHINKTEIKRDFWGCLYDLERMISS